MKATQMIDRGSTTTPRRRVRRRGAQPIDVEHLYDEWEEWTIGEMRACAHRLGIARVDDMSRIELVGALRGRGCTPG